MTAYPGLNEDFTELLDAFRDHGVEFVIIGAHALAAHGIPRATGDLDILVRCSQENAVRVMKALISFGAPVEAHGITERDFEIAGTVYQIGLAPRRIDILTAVSGPSFDQIWHNKLSASVDGRTLNFIGRDDLIANKLASGRDKDLLDVKLLGS